MTRSCWTVAFAMACLVASGAVRAHGDAGHAAGAKKFDRTAVEETAFGREGDPGRATRTIRIGMADTMRFTPAAITVERGETVELVVSNQGRVLHELVLGTADALREHAELMRRFPGMEHDEPHMVHVTPGASGSIVWQFTRPGEFQFACLIPGHFEAGMVGKVVVK